jgi:hypothetical protein
MLPTRERATPMGAEIITIKTRTTKKRNNQKEYPKSASFNRPYLIVREAEDSQAARCNAGAHTQPTKCEKESIFRGFSFRSARIVLLLLSCCFASLLLIAIAHTFRFSPFQNNSSTHN